MPILFDEFYQDNNILILIFITNVKTKVGDCEPITSIFSQIAFNFISTMLQWTFSNECFFFLVLNSHYFSCNVVHRCNSYPKCLVFFLSYLKNSVESDNMAFSVVLVLQIKEICKIFLVNYSVSTSSLGPFLLIRKIDRGSS